MKDALQKILWKYGTRNKLAELAAELILKTYRYFFVHRYNAERIRLLGPEIAAAHLILARRGRVKFHGVDRWYSKGDGNLDTVPGRFLDGVKVDTIDATGTDILYEGFEYFCEFFVDTSHQL